ncbi:hypothetical protein JAO76_12455 [Pontibacter sp. BT310]|uniref:Uncharacterized protein n=1 Tax=Pontibacter populi TaxID=890055 RepID=A0ABS6XCZ8_9BACT|nr:MULTISPECIES: hypothetical protein [Pontibacter]MBJ6119010.1 hypothetical protein [Pontibacter sp. BT310]MBR0571438.1 hypothetical protein [Microvirga sp. STS03]MBW3365864.1 hypothetical protein [Pontibacter populi]
MINEYKVEIIREPGPNPLTGEIFPFEYERLQIEATSVRSAYVIACATFQMTVRGQQLRFFIDGIEYFDETC